MGKRRCIPLATASKETLPETKAALIEAQLNVWDQKMCPVAAPDVGPRPLPWRLTLSTEGTESRSSVSWAPGSRSLDMRLLATL